MFRHNGYQQLLITQVKQNLEYNRNGCLFQDTFANPFLLKSFHRCNLNVHLCASSGDLALWQALLHIVFMLSFNAENVFPIRKWPDNIIEGQWGRGLPLPMASPSS